MRGPEQIMLVLAVALAVLCGGVGYLYGADADPPAQTGVPVWLEVRSSVDVTIGARNQFDNALSGERETTELEYRIAGGEPMTLAATPSRGTPIILTIDLAQTETDE